MRALLAHGHVHSCRDCVSVLLCIQCFCPNVHIDHFTMPPKRNRDMVWNDLEARMSAKRMKQTQVGKKPTGSLRQLVVQRLTAEPDNKQMYKPLQQREFVEFPYEDLTLGKLKISCAAHFGLPVSSCDVLVSNKGPSCTNINQIPHRKGKVSAYF